MIAKSRTAKILPIVFQHQGESAIQSHFSMPVLDPFRGQANIAKTGGKVVVPSPSVDEGNPTSPESNVDTAPNPADQERVVMAGFGDNAFAVFMLAALAFIVWRQA